jgi:hypothetical protein
MLSQLAGYLGGLQKPTASGDCLLFPSPTVIAVDANDIVTVEKIHGGVIQYTGFTAGRTLTIDTAVAIIAAFPEMDIGDSIMFCVSITTALAGTWVAAAGVTLAGRATVLANTFQLVILTRTGAATITLRAL